MKVLVYGAGVIGSYLAHVLIDGGNEVTLLARGDWKRTLEEKGLVIVHARQKKETVDHPRIVETVGPDESFDAVFAAMQAGQMREAFPTLARIDAKLLVLVGNNPEADEMEKELRRLSPEKTVLFGFSGTGGRREEGKVIVVRFGSAHLTCGKAHSAPDEQTLGLLKKLFTGEYRPILIDDMDGWLKCHIAFILPICFVSYAHSCNLRKARARELRYALKASGECCSLFRALDIPIVPEGDDKCYHSGPRHLMLYIMLRIMAATKIGELAASDHCRHAVGEMERLAAAIEELRSRAGDHPMPFWDKLKTDMPSWPALHEKFPS